MKNIEKYAIDIVRYLSDPKNTHEAEGVYNIALAINNGTDSKKQVHVLDVKRWLESEYEELGL